MRESCASHARVVRESCINTDGESRLLHEQQQRTHERDAKVRDGGQGEQLRLSACVENERARPHRPAGQASSQTLPLASEIRATWGLRAGGAATIGCDAPSSPVMGASFCALIASMKASVSASYASMYLRYVHAIGARRDGHRPKRTRMRMS
eukprot:6204797-Pleurochrysis_carterae.AAC.2